VNVTDRTGQSHCRLGLLAFGDSITNGGGELQWGVALQSWALWVARALGVPFTSYAYDGARVRDVLTTQIPEFERDGRDRHGRFELGCLYIGVNDVRGLDWDASEFERDFTPALTHLAQRADRVVALTAPLDLGRPRAGAKVRELNAVIARATAIVANARAVDLSTFGARNHVMVDHVHPTAFGQIEIAERVLRALEQHDGIRPHRTPSSLIVYETTRWRRLRGDVTYVYRRAKVTGRALRDRAILGLGPSARRPERRGPHPCSPSPEAAPKDTTSSRRGKT
jgi:lysophospholipase L1-like esterase